MIRALLRCPYFVATALFLAVMGGVEVVLASAGVIGVARWPIFSSTLATTAFASYIEVSRASRAHCPWLQQPLAVRLGSYISVLIVALTIVWPGLSLDPEILPIFRVGLPLFVVASMVVTTVHAYANHRTG